MPDLGTIVTAVFDSVRMAFFMFWETLWALVFGFALSGAVQAFVSRSEMERVMGDRRPRTLAVASLFGAASSSCSYAASAMAKSLFAKGADFTTAMVFMLASTNLVVELGLVLWVLIGWQFAVSEYIGGIIMISLLAAIARFAFRPRLIDAARRRLQAQGNSGSGGDLDALGAVSTTKMAMPFGRRLRSVGGWADAASYTLADLTMLRREMLIGYLVAGFLAVLVPTTLWNTVFFQGHGFATSVENALVGPLVAILSFVCSIGNVPLAAALWNGGISFGGVVSFIFADLISMPLLLIYRRYYGGALTLRILGAFWLVMAAAGLITQLLFSAAGLIPASHHLAIAEPSLQWNYTTFLNLVAVAGFVGLVWLARNRQRLGGAAGYAIDPVCGMQIETHLAPARASRDGRTTYFCSDRCRDRFGDDPDHFVVKARRMRQMTPEIDPVCGMTVDPKSAAATRQYAGKTIYFCNPGCARAFDADPASYLKTEQSA